MAYPHKTTPNTNGNQLILGPEILSRVFQCLSRISIQRCSLACREWHTIARPVVFRKIIIKNEKKYLRVNNLLEEQPEVCSWIKELCFDNMLDDSDSAAISTPEWVYAFATQLAPKMKRLECLEFVGLEELERDRVFPFITGLQVLSSIRTLRFVDCALSSNCLLAVACSFSNLVTLSIIQPSIFFDTDSTPRPALPKHHQLRLTAFKYHDYDDRIDDEDKNLLKSLLAELHSSGSLQTLRCLDFDIKDRLTLPQVGRLLQEVGPSFEDFTLKLPMSLKIWGKDRGQAEFKRHLNFSSMKSLRSLRFEDIKHPVTLDLLKTLPKPIELRRLTFGIEFNHVASLRNKDYAQLDEFLSSEHFSSMTEVWFDYKGVLDDNTVRKKAGRAFKGLDKRGMLGVSKVVREYSYVLGLLSGLGTDDET